jgi:chromate transporter
LQKRRYLIFLKDVFILAVTAIGGPNSHLPLFIERMVKRRKYITEEEVLELNALCRMIPGPASTQTITAVGYKMGGPNLAYLTLIIWVLPSLVIMTLAGIGINYFSDRNLILPFTKYLEPMAVGFVTYSAWVISVKVVNTKTAIVLMVVSSVISFFFTSPYVTPILIFVGGVATTYKYKRLPEEEEVPFKINWKNFVLFIGVFLATFVIGIATHSLPVKLFESFYRNGSLVFGGGQALIPLLHTEYVDMKQYLTSQEFMVGYMMVSAIPGPIFAISSYVGAISMKEFGIGGQVLGSLLATAGMFLPGTFLIFFVYQMWTSLKTNRVVKASLEGINAVSSGIVIAVAILLFETIDINITNLMVMSVSFFALLSEKIPAPILIIAGMLLGYLL